MKTLSKQEEIILLAVWRLEDNAYGITIRKYLKNATDRNISIGGIYVPLDRLVRRGFLKSYYGESTPERGGMGKRFYNLTPEGMEALKKAKQVHDKLWDCLPQLSFLGR